MQYAIAKELEILFWKHMNLPLIAAGVTYPLSENLAVGHGIRQRKSLDLDLLRRANNLGKSFHGLEASWDLGVWERWRRESFRFCVDCWEDETAQFNLYHGCVPLGRRLRFRWVETGDCPADEAADCRRSDYLNLNKPVLSFDLPRSWFYAAFVSLKNVVKFFGFSS